jgi:uncharacterized membrane protein (UPF0127 family)
MKQVKYRQVKNVRNGYVLGNRIRMAQGWKDRLIGLLGSSNLEEGSGLWLKPCKGIHTIGMRYSIDVVFMDKANRVQKVILNVLPFRMCPAKGKTHSVMEFPIGTIERCDIRVGDLLECAANQ